jgi:hypothetical protein
MAFHMKMNNIIVSHYIVLLIESCDQTRIIITLYVIMIIL